MAARLLVHHPLVLQTFGSFWLPAEAAVQFAGSRDGGKTNGGRSRVTLYNSAAPDSALAGAERWPPSAPLLLLPLLRRVDLVFSGYLIRGFGDYKSFTVLPCRRSCPRPRTRGSHAVCLWFVTVCTSVCVCVRVGVVCCLPPLSSVLWRFQSSASLAAPQTTRQENNQNLFFGQFFCFLPSAERERETEQRTKVAARVCPKADGDSMPCVCVAGPQEEATLGSAGWASPEELLEQASQAQQLERLAQLCIMSKQ